MRTTLSYPVKRGFAPRGSPELLCIASAMRMEGCGKTPLTWERGARRGEEAARRGPTSAVIYGPGIPTYLLLNGSSGI